MRIRLWHRGSRLVVVRRRRGNCQRWLSVHLTPPPWRALFEHGMALLDLGAIASGGATVRVDSAGVRVDWTGGRYWTRIDVRIDRGSARKRELAAGALLKTARYVLLPGTA